MTIFIQDEVVITHNSFNGVLISKLIINKLYVVAFYGLNTQNYITNNTTT